MKVILKTAMAGPRGCFNPGDVIEVDKAVGQQLIAGGSAEKADASAAAHPNPIETAMAEPKEAAVAPAPAARKGFLR